jgi:ubiquinone/menaquinone biosynthesis C-methylase UbiE
MGWVILAVLGIAGLAVLFIILTDGRYFGKRLMYWVYDRVGPAMFGARSEAERWHAMADALQLRGGESILDVGTATGDLPLTIAALPNFHGQVTGVDWSPQMIAQAQAEASQRGLGDRARFQVVDVRKPLPYSDGEFDAVFCLGLLETWPHPERILAEMARVTNPSGALVVSLYRGWASRSVALSFDWYQHHLAALGFEDLRVAPCRRDQDVVIARQSAP